MRCNGLLLILILSAGIYGQIREVTRSGYNAKDHNVALFDRYRCKTLISQDVVELMGKDRKTYYGGGATNCPHGKYYLMPEYGGWQLILLYQYYNRDVISYYVDRLEMTKEEGEALYEKTKDINRYDVTKNVNAEVNIADGRITKLNLGDFDESIKGLYPGYRDYTNEGGNKRRVASNYVGVNDNVQESLDFRSNENKRKWLRNLRNALGEILTNERVSYKSIFIAKDEQGPEFLKKWVHLRPLFTYNESGVVFCILQKCGEWKFQHAVYGVWQTDKEAKKYGFEQGQQVFISKKERLSEIAKRDKYAKSLYSCFKDGDSHFANPNCAGYEYFTYGQVINNKDEVYEKLWWENYELNSNCECEFDGQGFPIKNTHGDIPPPHPDDYSHTTNPPGMMGVPDMENYLGIFLMEYEKIVGDIKEEGTPQQWLDYRDYMGKRMMSVEWDGTIYNENWKIGPQDVSVDNPPEQPYLFTDDCELYNKPPPQYQLNALEDDAMYFLASADLSHETYEYKKWGWLPLDKHTQGVYVFLVNVTDGVKQAVAEVKEIMEFAIDDPYFIINEVMTDFREDKNSYSGNIGDLEISISLKESEKDRIFLARDIYIGNANNNNERYEKIDDALLFDKYYQETGEPFKVVSKEYGEDAFWDEDIRAQNDSKKWYVKWKYKLISRDEFDVKRVIGTIKISRMFCKENNKFNDDDTKKHQSLITGLLNPAAGLLTKSDWLNYSGQEKTIKYYHGIDNFKQEDRYLRYLDGNRFKKLEMKRDLFESYLPKDRKIKLNTHLYVSAGEREEDYDQANYSKDSKEYHTDQMYAKEREGEMSEKEKNEAIKDIITKIAVSEGLDLIMKGIYALAEKKDQAIPLYEAGKRLNNKLTQSVSYKVAKEIYEAYCIYKQTMDLMAEIRDTYKNIIDAWDGLCYSVGNIHSYYENLDIEDIKLSNISSVMPSVYFKYLDANIYHLHSTINNHALAIDAMAFYCDSLNNGNWLILNPVIRGMTQAICKSSYTNTKAKEIIYENTRYLDDQLNKNKGERGVSNSAYLSNITATTQNMIRQAKLSVYNERLRGLSHVLNLVEAETNDWIEYSNYMYSLPANLKERVERGEMKEEPLKCLQEELYSARAAFRAGNQEVYNVMTGESY